jgi:flagellar motor switch protein FliG
MPRKVDEGARNAAILMLSIGEERAAALFKQMDDNEIRDVSRQMSMLGRISSEEVERVLTDFASSVSTGGTVVGSWQNTERILRSFLEEDRVSDILEEMRGPAGRTMWEKLANVSEDILANYLKNEYPQTVAVIMSRIKPGHAARVLSALPGEFAYEVIERMLLMDNVSREVIDSVEGTLRNEFMKNLAARNKRDSHEVMAEIFNNLDRANEAKFMGLLEQRRLEDANRIRAMMFTFEDLMKTDDKGIQTILREVPDKEKLKIALKGAPEELRQRFFANMSERAAKILQEDMAGMGPVRVKDVDEAQQAVVAVAKRLADEGQIVIAEEGGADEFVY